MQISKKHIIAIIVALISYKAGAQGNIETQLKADIVSQYIWRGQECGEASLQPSLGISYGGLSLSAWGSVGIVEAADTKEFDLTLGYTTGGLTVGITDYWFNTPSRKYFLYDAHKTSHMFEASIGYDFGLASLTWNTVFAGNDGLNNKGKRAYSSYVEAAAPFKLGTLDCTASIGAVPYQTSLYADANGFCVTNISLVASKDIKITDSFALPIFAAINTNPSTQKAAFVVGITLKP